ncbi:MAG: hypothetical protein ACRD47_16865, partial [Nitrososphaeraceae archaeon]
LVEISDISFRGVFDGYPSRISWNQPIGVYTIYKRILRSAKGRLVVYLQRSDNLHTNNHRIEYTNKYTRSLGIQQTLISISGCFKFSR